MIIKDARKTAACDKNKKNQREALRMGVEHLATLFPVETKDFQFVVENENRNAKYKVDTQSMRLFGIRNDHAEDVHRADANRLEKNNHENDEEEAVQDEDMDSWKAKGGSSSSKNSPQTQKDEMLGNTKFIVLQKNTRSMNTSERLEELFSEVHQVAWDVKLISETWRQGKEIWETQQGT